MISKVIYIGYQPLTEKVKEDFYFQELINKKIQVEYWDLSDIYFKNILESKLIDKNIIKISSISMVEDLLKKNNLNTTIFHLTITFEFRVIKLFRLLTKYKCNTSFFARGVLPTSDTNSKLTGLFLKVVKVFNLKLLTVYIKNKYAFFLKKLGKIGYYNLVFKAGKDGLKAIGVGSQIELKKSKIIDVNSFDFEKFKSAKGAINTIKRNYCVYLDEYLPFHPDFKLFNMPTVEPDEFFESLNIFFKKIEIKYNVEVVIAAHPKAEKYVEINFFQGRKVLFNNTAELTKHAEFVLFHCSTSIGFALLNGKSIISLNMNCIEKSMPNFYKQINNFSRVLDSNLININNFLIEKLDLPSPNHNKYEKYIYTYLTSRGSENIKSSEIFINTLINFDGEIIH
jgi:hypothetical protein